jgi:hypothetical protein
MSAIKPAASIVDREAAEMASHPRGGADPCCTVSERPDSVDGTRRSAPGLSMSLQPTSMCAALARIYRPSRSVMQAGRTNTKRWVLEFEPRLPPFLEPLMGWTGSADTLQQVRLMFATKEQAVAFAERQGWSYELSEPREPRFQPKSYADNFRNRPAASSAARPQQEGSAPGSFAQRFDPRPHRSIPPSAAAKYAGPAHHRKARRSATAAHT